MLKTLALGPACALAFTGAAFAQNMAATHSFLAKAGASDKYEVAAAAIAQDRSQNPRVQGFARMMVRDHTDSSMKLKAAGEADMGHPLPDPTTTPEQEKMLAALRDAPPRTFDRTYMDQQDKAHEAALDLMKGYAATGDYPRTKATAGEIAMTVQKHLDMARDIRDHLK